MKAQPFWPLCLRLARGGQTLSPGWALARAEPAQPGASSTVRSCLFLSDSRIHDRVTISCFECSFCADRERDDLMSALVSVRSSLTDVQQREAGAYEQVKQAVLVAEEASFEKTKASLRRSR